MAAYNFCFILVFCLHFVRCYAKPVSEWSITDEANTELCFKGTINFEVKGGNAGCRVMEMESKRTCPERFKIKERLKKAYDADTEIEDIANKEYDTVHGRILAVNMAHIRKKRQTAKNGSASENVFHKIQEANSANISDFYQGDIELDPELEEYVRSGGHSRNAIRARKRLWTSRIIPYRIPSYMSYITSNVQQAINELHSKTCVRFVNYHSGYHKNYIEFGNSRGCSSKVGKHYAVPGKQMISIGDGCNFVGTILHEMMHALGFFHEQARMDRDKYVKIYWENILEGFSDQFDKYGWETIDDLGVRYDYQSIMHYNRKAFTKNGRPTIVAIGNENMEFKTKDFRLSTLDALEINRLYDCRTTSYGWTSWSGWTPCDDSCTYRTRERFCYNSGNLQSCGGNGNVYGVETQKQKCTPSMCVAAVDGQWSRWSDWSVCSKTCNDGTRTRFRKCNSPAPAYGGKPCAGSANYRGSCILKRCHLDNDDVDFENSRLGMWSNSKSDKLDWQFHSGYTKTMETGPSRDHTSGRGYYLYVEASGTTPGQTADLVSPWITAKNGGQCLKFYYTMYGKTMGSLSIKMELSNGKSWYIFYMNGDQGIDWKKGTGNIDVPSGLSYRLTIQGKVGNYGYSDIAIDDVYIDPGLCTCQDDFYTCHIWAAKGECTANEVWMKRNCKRSCKVCGGVTPSNCEDSNKVQCPLWTQNGECQKNPTWMSANCRKSCKRCASTCKDSNGSCPAWAKLGECTKNPAWMNSNCKLSCKQC